MNDKLTELILVCFVSIALADISEEKYPVNSDDFSRISLKSFGNEHPCCLPLPNDLKEQLDDEVVN